MCLQAVLPDATGVPHLVPAVVYRSAVFEVAQRKAGTLCREGKRRSAVCRKVDDLAIVVFASYWRVD